MRAPVVIFAVGNSSRGDDALGPLLAACFRAEVLAAGMNGSFEVIEDFQLQVEHVLDLEDRSLALFIDAGSGTPAPYVFRPIAPAVGFGHSTHALAPETLLDVFRQSLVYEPPAAFLLCIRGESFELGTDLSPAAAGHLQAALELVRRLVLQPSAEAWAEFQDAA